MLKTLSAMALAALVGAAVLLPAMSPQVSANAPRPGAKSDLADIPAACERQGWPYYDAACLRDENRNAGRVPLVRVVTTDRVTLKQPAAPVFEPLPPAPGPAMPVNPLAVPAWPEHMANLTVLAVR
jgi:hypothetical protein